MNYILKFNFQKIIKILYFKCQKIKINKYIIEF